MKIIKSDERLGGLRVVKRFAIFPKQIGAQWVWLTSYYQLQRNSYWGFGWIKDAEGESLNEHEWDFKWDEKYLALWNK